jgi:catechol 2,3-dioxygenase-like lactoylglutathione lyase family enzyme
VTAEPVVRLTDAISIVPVRDVRATVAFYADTLGFEAVEVDDDPGFAIVRRDSAIIHLIGTDDAGALEATATNIAIYIWVAGLDRLWAELAPILEPLPQGRVRGPFDQPYGVREFHVKDPDGCLLFFAERKSESD